MRRIRFSLRMLFVLATAVVLFLGYSQIRRRSMLREANKLKTGGASFVIDDGWLDKIWLRTPKEAVVTVERLPTAKYLVGQKAYATDEVIGYGENLKRRIADFGIKEVGILLWRTKKGSRNLCALESFDTLIPIEAFEQKQELEAQEVNRRDGK